MAAASAAKPPRRRVTHKLSERIIEWLLFLAAASSVAVTVGIVYVLVFESYVFFEYLWKEGRLTEFFTHTRWTPAFDDAEYGILPLLNGTILIAGIALLIAVPFGLTTAIYISEFAGPRAREVIKPIMEILSDVPTVVYGYFAFLFVTPLLKATLFPDISAFNALSAGLVMGIMIIPYVASVSEDAMRAVPMSLREGSFAMGATRLETAIRVVFPAAISGVLAAFILGISRAVGETMIVKIAAGSQPVMTLDPTESAATITAFIVAISHGDLPYGSLAYLSIYAAGLTLFVMTLSFNLIAFFIRKRYREIYE
ncbi:MAG: phosphate ABC transporter permease subunit PstC [Alphaproteobacteria bacterium]|nr:phosphate ABC transporter permease subunit PstC [Alphaproteobacteria bacterium]